jgi:hypothetical protein
MTYARMASRFITGYDRAMMKQIGPIAVAAGVAAGVLANYPAHGQTPEQQQMWDAQRAQTLVEEKARLERLNREREARRADPMGWVRTLDPLTGGGWEFRSVSEDGSWATFTTNHQLKRSGKTVTIWLRQEYAEPQSGDAGKYLSVVQKVQYDCGKQQERPLLVVYYASNNIQGNAQTDEGDVKTTPWNAIIPGTRDESNFLWACATKP